MGNAGRVLMIPKGDYNPATPYEMLDCVYYNGRSYVCKQRSTGNLPTNTTYWQPMTPDSNAEIQALTNQLEDETKARTALGAHNWFNSDPSNIRDESSGITTTQTDTGVRIQLSTAGTYKRTQFYLTNLVADIDYVLTVNVAITSGASNVMVYDVNTDTVVIDKPNTSGKITLNFNSGSYTSIVLALYVTQNTAETADITFSDILIRLATDTDPNYQPYAKTNLELTQALGGFELAIHEGTAPADTTNYKTENIQTILGFKPSYFIILAAERYNNANSIWYQMSNDMTANDYVIKAASDNGVDFRVKFSDVTNYTKYRAVILYKR